ncbi:hypothetical protein [uncultured Photobacterium sp.]|uniref:hypothetical protein n=1 Tax=uncultured Photobacterium sp. TaxID=173973 RepID=UPI00263A23D9|nr:hypothetical protein [uncultured Photobacterium sp.]
MRLSVNMLSLLPEERIIIDSNSWENIGTPYDLRCTPQGKELEVKYHNGDYLYLRFLELASADQATRRYSSDVFNSHLDINYPITVVEINMSIGGTSINLTLSETTFGGNTIKGGLMSHCGFGIVLSNTGLDWLQNPKWKLQSKVEHVEGTNIVKVKFGR